MDILINHSKIIVFVLSLIVLNLLKNVFLVKKDFKKGILLYTDIGISTFILLSFLISFRPSLQFMLMKKIHIYGICVFSFILFYILKIIINFRKNTTTNTKTIFLAISTMLEIIILIFLETLEKSL